jgi:DHA1 family purine base/nucleoside efflux pump-like MFS transporter
MGSRSKEELRIVSSLFLILFIGVADNQVLSPLLPAIQSQLGKSTTVMGFLFTGYSFCAGLSALIWGPLSDAFGRRQGLLSGLMVFFAGSAISFAARDFTILLAGRIVTGMGASMLSLNTISYAADFFPYKTRGWAMGCIFTSYFAALILGVPLGSWMGEKFGWSAVFGSMAGIALTLFISTKWMLPRLYAQVIRTSEVQLSACVRQYIGFLKTQVPAAALLSALFASAGTMGFIAFLGMWLSNSFGIPGSKIGLVFLISGTAALLASPLAGYIADRIGKRIQFVISSVSLAVFLYVLPGLRWGSVLFAVFGVISLSAAFRQGPMEAVFTQIVPSILRGRFIALKNSFSQLGIGLATMLSGILFEYGGYSAVCILGAISNLLAAGSMFLTFKQKRL